MDVPTMSVPNTLPIRLVWLYKLSQNSLKLSVESLNFPIRLGMVGCSMIFSEPFDINNEFLIQKLESPIGN